MQDQRKRQIGAVHSSDDEDQYQDLPSKQDSEAAQLASDADTDDSESGLNDTAIDKDDVVMDEGVSDLDYLKSRTNTNVVQARDEDETTSQTSSWTDTGQGGSLLTPLLPKNSEKQVWIHR